MKVVFETEYDNDNAKVIEKTFEAAAKYFAIPKRTEIILSFLTAEEIREVNNVARSCDSVTDVLSFPYLEGIKGRKIKLSEHKTDIDPETNRLMLGEINICIQRACEQAKEYGHSEERECAYLALHGLLHLLGYDHMREDDKAEMRKKEEEILSSVGINR